MIPRWLALVLLERLDAGGITLDEFELEAREWAELEAQVAYLGRVPH